MSSGKPFFSIVLPTYNRAHLLPIAIKSVLQQTFGDFELVISNGGSTDNTKQVVASFDDSRIRYVESEKRLNIGDNYQNGLMHASGEYITFFSDDDVFIPTTLERVKRVIDEHRAEVLAFHVAQYVQDGDYEHQVYVPKNSLEIPLFTGEVTEFTPREALKILYARFGLINGVDDDKLIVSFVGNAVYHNSIFKRIQAKEPHIFATTPADMYLAGAVNYVVNSYFCLSEPLLVWSRWGGNATASPGRHAKSLLAHYERLLGGKTLDSVPLKAASPHNCVVNAVLTAKNDFDTDNALPVDWVRYFVASNQHLNHLRVLGVNVEREFAEYQTVLSAQPAELQRQVRAEIDLDSRPLKTGALPKIKQSVKDFVKFKSPNAFQMLKRIAGRADNPITNIKVVNGGEVGFSDLTGAAQYVNDHCLPVRADQKL